MQNITIFSLEQNFESLKKVIELSNFSKKLFHKSSFEMDLMLKTRGLLNLCFVKSSEEKFFTLKLEAITHVEDLIAKDEKIKSNLINYIKASEGVVNIQCEQGFDNESFLISANLTKAFNGIIYMDGVFINSDTRVLIDLEGNTETDDFIGSSEYFPIEDDDESYLNILKTLDIHIDESIPNIKTIQEIHIKNTEKIVRRALCLTFLGSYSESLLRTNHISPIRDFLFNQIRKYDITDDFTKAELDFIFNNKPVIEDIESFTKSYESAYVLFWTLSLVENLSFPPEPCFSHELIMATSRFWGIEEIIAASVIKSETDIIKAFNLSHHLLVNIIENKNLGILIPESINVNVLKVRNKTFNWLTSSKISDWDII